MPSIWFRNTADIPEQDHLFFRKLVFKILKNNLIDYYRHWQVEEKSKPYLSELISTHQRSVEEIIIFKEISDACMKIIDSLDIKEKETIQRLIATQNSQLSSPAKERKQLSRLRKKIKEQIKNELNVSIDSVLKN